MIWPGLRILFAAKSNTEIPTFAYFRGLVSNQCADQPVEQCQGTLYSVWWIFPPINTPERKIIFCSLNIGVSWTIPTIRTSASTAIFECLMKLMQGTNPFKGLTSLVGVTSNYRHYQRTVCLRRYSESGRRSLRMALLFNYGSSESAVRHCFNPREGSRV